MTTLVAAVAVWLLIPWVTYAIAWLVTRRRRVLRVVVPSHAPYLRFLERQPVDTGRARASWKS